jgi:hypothetical protein
MVKRPTAVQRKPEDETVQEEPHRVRPQWLMRDAVDALQPGDAGHGEFAERMMEGAPSPGEPSFTRSGKTLRPVLPVSLIDELDKGYQTRRHRLIAALDSRPKLYKQIAVAALASMLTGALAGLVVYERAHDGALTKTAMQWIGERVLPPSTSSRKEMATTKLAVADMMATPHVQSLLPIAVQTGQNQPLSLRLTGLPEAAYLTAGKRIDDRAWLVSSDELQQARLAFHRQPDSSFSLSVAAVEPATGTLAAPVQEMKIDIGLEQVAAGNLGEPQPDPSFPASTSSSKTDLNPYPSKRSKADELLARADALFQAGNIEDARRLYAQANSLSASDALLGLAKTYDPDILAKLNIKNSKPDTDAALAYYRQAEAAGAAGAKEAIEALQRTAK